MKLLTCAVFCVAFGVLCITSKTEKEAGINGFLCLLSGFIAWGIS